MMARVSFNYDVIEDPEIRAAARDHAKQIRTSLSRSAQTIVEIGRRLELMREAMGASLFRNWVSTEFSWTQASASNWMRAAMLFGNRKDLDLFQPSAITALVRRNIPQTLIDEAFEKAKAREVVTGSWVRARINALNLPPTMERSRKVVKVRRGAAPILEEMCFVFDQWEAMLPETIRALSSEELQGLQERIEQLAAQIRAASRPAERPQARRGRRGAVLV